MPKSDQELKQLAQDICTNLVFTDRHVESSEQLAMVFMVIALMNKKQQKEFMKQDVGLVYEYMNKAGPRAINGMPCFFSFQTITKDESLKVFEYVNKFKEFWGKQNA